MFNQHRFYELQKDKVFKYFKLEFHYQFHAHNFDGFWFLIHHTIHRYECLIYSFKSQVFYHWWIEIFYMDLRITHQIIVHLCRNIVYYFFQISSTLMNLEDDNILFLLSGFECINLNIWRFILLVNFCLFRQEL
jgi:hypothetical protein